MVSQEVGEVAKPEYSLSQFLSKNQPNNNNKKTRVRTVSSWIEQKEAENEAAQRGGGA